MTVTHEATATDLVNEGLRRVAMSPDRLDDPDHSRTYRLETIHLLERALKLSPPPDDEVLAKLNIALQYWHLQQLEPHAVDRILVDGLESCPDAYAALSWFREAAIADRRLGVRLWDRPDQSWAEACAPIDACIELAARHAEGNGRQAEARTWRESFAIPLDHLETPAIPVTLLGLGIQLAASGDKAAAAACYGRIATSRNHEATSRAHAESNLRVLEWGETSTNPARSVGFRGSWKVLLVLAGLTAFALFGSRTSSLVGRLEVGGFFAGLAILYWWWKSR